MIFSEIPRVFLTLRCNYKCSFCPYITEKRNELSGGEWIDLLQQYPGDEVIFTGGEPTLHADFIDIVLSLIHI